MLRKAIAYADKTVDLIAAIVCLLLFLVCLYAMYDACMVYYRAADKSALVYKPETGGNPEILRDLSEDAVAWLTVEGTRIDYPVMQGKTNSTYLNTDPFGDFSLSGSIFLDSRCSSDFSDPYSMIYGHHMEYGAMFGALDEFYDPDYFAGHRDGTLTTVGGETFRIRFFACCRANATEPLIFDPPDSSRPDLLAFLAAHAAVFESSETLESARIIALSTCQNGENIERIIVFGTLDG